MKRILITGSNGLLGQKLIELLVHGNNYNVLSTSKHERSVFGEQSVAYRQLDTTNRQAVRSLLEEFEPDVVINTAAITNVDACESDKETAWHVNVKAVENIAHTAKLNGAHVIHLSTDYVFDGKNGPYDERDRPNPISYYGKTNLACENVLRTNDVSHTIVRTMVLYGVGIKVKSNFALWLLKNLSQEKSVKVVDDQFGNPTLVDDLAFAILKIVELRRLGIYHIAGHDLVSRYDFAIALAKIFGYNKKFIEPIKTASLLQPAPRPLKSGFITLKAETDLGYKPSSVDHGLTVFRSQMNSHLKQHPQTESTEVRERKR